MSEIKSRVRVGVLSIAHMHSGSYIASLKARTDVELVGIWDDDTARGENAANAHGTPFYSDIARLLDENLDGIIITSENIYHHTLIETVCAADAKPKIVLCEKPLATTAGNGRAMIDAARAAGIFLGTAFPCRYSPAFQRALAIVREGKLGRIRALRETNHGSCPFGWFVDTEKSGGGAVIDHTVHVADLNRLLLGVEATEVYAEIGSNMYHQDWEDCGILTISYEDGVFASLDPSWSRPPKSFRTWGDVTIDIIGDGGVLSIDLFNQGFSYYSESNGTNRSVGWGSNTDAGLIADFVRVAAGESPTILANGEDGLRAAEVAFAAYESVRTRSAVKIVLA